MSPTIAKPGALGSDLEVGTPEWERVRREHDEEVARGARLRQLQARLPLEIHDSDVRVRDLAGRLGLDLPTVGGGLHPVVRRRPAGNRHTRGSDGLTATQRETLAALPATRAEAADAIGEVPSVVGQRLADLVRRGLATKDPGYGGVYRPAARNGDGP